MTLDEAIKRYPDNAEYERTHGNLQGCIDFKHLAEWLKELKKLKEQETILDKIRAEVISLTDGCTPELIRNVDVLEIIDKYKAESEDKE